MKEILLIRHGKSEWGDISLRDHDRPLKKRGRKEAKAMGERLVSLGFEPQLLLVSSAKRAQETAEQLLQRFKCPRVTEPLIYDANVSDIEEIIQKQDDAVSRIALVGHNPTFTEAVMYARYPLVNLPTAGVAIFRFDECASWSDVAFSKGRVVDVLRPKE